MAYRTSYQWAQVRPSLLVIVCYKQARSPACLSAPPHRTCKSRHKPALVLGRQTFWQVHTKKYQKSTMKARWSKRIQAAVTVTCKCVVYAGRQCTCTTALQEGQRGVRHALVQGLAVLFWAVRRWVCQPSPKALQSPLLAGWDPPPLRHESLPGVQRPRTHPCRAAY